MAFADVASLGHSADEVESGRWPLAAGFLIGAALVGMVASSYVGALRFAPSSLTVSHTQLHSSPASLTAASKSGVATSAASSSASSSVAASSGDGIVPESEGMVSAQAAASAFDNVSH